MIKLKFNIHRILIAPLDWGLGHATRCIPVVKALQACNYEVIIACNKLQQNLLQQEFPAMRFLFLEGYNIRYTANKNMLPFKIIQQLPKINKSIQREHQWLEKTVDDYQIDLVISDNRFGLYTSKVPCVFITHQLTIKAPFAFIESALQAINYKYINRYNACWVPDVANNPGIAGILSHPQALPKTRVDYIGPLSRFQKKQELGLKYDCCIVLSGPEPQRTVLENLTMSLYNLPLF